MVREQGGSCSRTCQPLRRSDRMTATISRDEARAKGLKRYFTNIPCNKGHISERYLGGKCVACAKEEGQLPRVAGYKAKYRDSNRALENEKSRLRYREKADHESKRKAEAYARNPAPFLLRGKRWASTPEGRASKAASAARRRAAILQATPRWLTQTHHQEIFEIYLTCPEGFHVDHRIPLQGKNVCGLHVPWNLQHLPAADNRRKSNKF